MRASKRLSYGLISEIQLKGFCRVCRRVTKTGWHHIKPRSEGGTNHPRNLLESCYECHNDIEQLDWKYYHFVYRKNKRKPRRPRGIWGVNDYGNVYCILDREDNSEQEMRELRDTISRYEGMEKVLFRQMQGGKMEQAASSYVPGEVTGRKRVIRLSGFLIYYHECQCDLCKK